MLWALGDVSTVASYPDSVTAATTRLGVVVLQANPANALP
jgi:hypothetical protein